MRTRFFTIAALVSAGALTVNAQTPQTPPSNPQTQRPTAGDTTQRTGATAGDQVVTVTGCLREEKDVPGRSPNAAERAGMGEDYVLTNVKMSQSSSTSGIGLATMYEVEGINDDELKKHIGHQVEVTGRISMANRGGATGATGGRTTGATGTTGTGTTGTGTTGTTGATGTGATGAGARQGAGAQGGSNADLPEINATSIKMVAATCPAQ